MLEKKFNNDDNIEVICIPYDDDNYYVGKSWSSVKDDETGLQFKQNIERIISEKLVLDTIKFGTYEECWRD